MTNGIPVWYADSIAPVNNDWGIGDVEKGTIKIVSNTLQNNSSVAVTARGYGNFGQGGAQWVTTTCPANTTTTVISGGSQMDVCYVEGPSTYNHTRTWGTYSGTSAAFSGTKTVYEATVRTDGV